MRVKPWHICWATGLVVGTVGHWLIQVGRALVEKGNAHE